MSLLIGMLIASIAIVIEGLVILGLFLLGLLLSCQRIPAHKDPFCLLLREIAPAHQTGTFTPHLSAHHRRRKIPDLCILTLVAPAHPSCGLPAKVSFCAEVFLSTQQLHQVLCQLKRFLER